MAKSPKLDKDGRVVKPSCGECRHYTPTAVEDSGIPSAAGDGTNWHYPIGRCALPVVLGCRGDDHIPSWHSCHRGQWKRGAKPTE